MEEMKAILEKYFSQKDEIDLADLSKAEGVFLCQIMRGTKIKFAPKVFMKYQMKALFLREDFLPILERCRKERLRRFANGT